MSRTRASDDDDDFGGDEPEYSPESDEAGELWCPKCGKVMYADAALCPHCNEYVTPGARPSGSLPGWMWLGVVILVAVLLAGAVAGAFL